MINKINNDTIMMIRAVCFHLVSGICLHGDNPTYGVNTLAQLIIVHNSVIKSLFQKRLCMSYLEPFRTTSCIGSIVCECKYWTIVITPSCLIDINIKLYATFNCGKQL